ncbi:MAG: HD domain-containing protein [Candidatus Paceibacterota bacterium]|jgi:(p)ppGpp synthase/HD superfamily hydrolase
MKLTDKIEKSINFSAQKHLGQTRKNGESPYIVHPFSVAWIISEYTDDEDTIVAGLLHDILEDVKGCYYQDLAENFGEKVAEIVKGVTEDKDPNIEQDGKDDWLERKQKYIDNLKTARIESVFVAAADKINNLNSMAIDYQKTGEKFWEKFDSPLEKMIWFKEEVFKVVKQRIGGNAISDKLEKTLLETKKAINFDQ